MELQADYKSLLMVWKYVFPDLCSSKEPSPLLLEKVRRGEIGSKTGKGFYDWTPESERIRREELRSNLFGLLHGVSDKPGKT